MIVHNGLENIWGLVMAVVFISGLSMKLPGFMVNKVAMGLPEHFGISCK
jgi:hypothetical protein